VSGDRWYPGGHAARRPDDDALVLASTGERWSWRRLDEESNRVAHVLRGLGLQRGDHVALLMENRLEFFAVMWAALRSGLRYTAVNSYLGTDETAEVLRVCEPSAVVTSRRHAEAALEAARGLDPLPVVLLVDSPDTLPQRLLPSAVSDLTDLAASAPTRPIEDESAGAPLWFSSGTSGRPKGVVRPMPDGPPGAPDPVAQHYVELFGLDERTVHLSVGPLHHAAPVGFSTAVHRAGGTVVLAERFDPAEVLAFVERYRITFTHLVPTMFVRMLKLPDEQRSSFDLSSLQRVIHGAAPCPVEVKRQMIEWWGPIIDEYYGGTEGVGSTVISAREWLEHPGSVGQASRGSIHIVDDGGAELPPGETGMVFFENPAGTSTYHGDESETAAITHPAGWQTLGDVGHLDDDGYLFLTDRWTHKIVTGGVNVFPREVEDVLLAHPAVMDVAVIGVPDAEMGEEVRAVVELVDPSVAEGERADELAAGLVRWCRERLAHYKCPRAVDFDPRLPRGDNGKIYKRLIRDRYWRERDRRI
jgi:long-chain acyl-CoA synthetase